MGCRQLPSRGLSWLRLWPPAAGFAVGVRRSSLSPTQHREVADQKTILSACWHMAKISRQGVLLDGHAREQP